jgi:S1-C subfamily serine protease
MKRKILISLLMLSMFIGGAVTASSINGDFKGRPIVKVFVDGKTVNSEVPAYIEDGNTMLPLRAVSEALGADIKWNPDDYSVSVSTKKAALTQDQLKEISKYVAKVYAVNADGQDFGRASGFLIGNGIVVTNEHVGGVAASLRIELNGQTYTTSNVLFKNATTDVMGVKIDAVGGLTYSTDLPPIDAHVYAIGYPHGELKISEGKVLQGYPPVNGVDGLYHSARTESGQSGGILISDSGEVIGITKGSSDDFSVDLAVPMKYVQQEINKL